MSKKSQSQLHPLHDNVVIEIVEEEKKSAGNLSLPAGVEENSFLKGKVVEIGPGKTNYKYSWLEGKTVGTMKDCYLRIPLDVAVGDYIICKKYSPDLITIGKRKLMIVNEQDVVATIDKSAIKQLLGIEADYEKDTMQPGNPKFKKAYPKSDPKKQTYKPKVKAHVG